MIDPQEAIEKKSGKDAGAFMEFGRRLEACIDAMLVKEYDGQPLEVPISDKWDEDVVHSVIERYRESGWSVFADTGRIFTFVEAVAGQQAIPAVA